MNVTVAKSILSIHDVNPRVRFQQSWSSSLRGVVKEEVEGKCKEVLRTTTCLCKVPAPLLENKTSRALPGKFTVLTRNLFYRYFNLYCPYKCWNTKGRKTASCFILCRYNFFPEFKLLVKLQYIIRNFSYKTHQVISEL